MAYFVWGQDNRRQYLAEAFDTVQDSLSFNGVISIVQDDSMFFNGFAGFANKEFRNEISSTTKFRIASLSKPLISYAIHILADQGKLSFESSISDYLPELSGELTDKILLKHLIGHTSGLIRDFKIIENGSDQKYYARYEIIDLINRSKLQSEPGEHYAYSNTGYTLLAIIIENATKLPLNEALDHLLFQPLGMNSTGHEQPDKIYDQFASGYDKLGDVFYKGTYEDKSHAFGAGSFYSSASDMLKFASEVINGSLLSQDMHARYIEDIGSNRTAGGWITWNYSSQLDIRLGKDQVPDSACPPGSGRGQVVYFAGSCPGFRSFMSVYLEHRIAIVGLMNQVPVNPSKLNNVFGNIMVGYELEEIRTPILQQLLPRILTEDLVVVQKEYEDMVRENPDRSFRDYEVNRVGYILLGHHETENAIKVFRFMTMVFPDNSNAFDSLGEALIAHGDIERGLSAYQRSLELNPNNGNAKAIIELYK